MPTVKVEFGKFEKRIDRSKFVYTRFGKYFDGKTLDIGCYEAPLREMIGRCLYVGVDIAGDPDIRADLNRTVSLPFADQEFKTVIAIETLEHIDELHRLFAECVRVARTYLIVSLPNCWRDARVPIARGRGSFAHYGLPVNPPLDRHRWFFNFTDAIDFFRQISSKYGMEIIEIFGTEQPRSIVVRWLRKLRYSPTAYQNRYVQTAWVVLRKR
jgi:hypothetical protein